MPTRLYINLFIITVGRDISEYKVVSTGELAQSLVVLCRRSARELGDERRVQSGLLSQCQRAGRQGPRHCRRQGEEEALSQVCGIHITCRGYDLMDVVVQCENFEDKSSVSVYRCSSSSQFNESLLVCLSYPHSAMKMLS